MSDGKSQAGNNDPGKQCDGGKEEKLEKVRMDYGRAKPRVRGALMSSEAPWRQKLQAMDLQALGQSIATLRKNQEACQSARFTSARPLRKRSRRPQSCRMNTSSLHMLRDNEPHRSAKRHKSTNIFNVIPTISEDQEIDTTPLPDTKNQTQTNVSGLVSAPMNSPERPTQAQSRAQAFEDTKQHPTSPPGFPAHIAERLAAAHRETPTTPTRLQERPEPHSPEATNGAYSDLSEGEGEGSPASDPEDLIKKQPPKLSSRYTFVEYLGHGSYGHVYGALDMETGEKVAIKRITGVFDDVMHAKRLLRELRILRVLRHDHIIELRDILPPPDINDFNELYIVFEFADTDMQKLINSNQHFSNLHIQFFLYQILVSLKYVHAANIIHRDLKPANILINANCSLLLCDFGLARGSHQRTARYVTPTAPPTTHPGGSIGNSTVDMDVKDSKTTTILPEIKIPQDASLIRAASQLTKHVVTRWYRAPELILLASNYNCSIDMWSVGCVLSELLSMQSESIKNPKERSALFPGKSCFPLSADNPLAYTDPVDQLSVIFDVIGTPDEADINAVSSHKARKYLQSLPKKPSLNLQDKFPGANPQVLDLMKGLLQFNPKKRLTADQALSHEYLKDVRDAATEKKSMTGPIYFEFEDEPITKSMIKDLIVKEVLFYNPKLKNKDSNA